MKNFINSLICLVVCVAVCPVFTACNKEAKNVDLWESAVYTEDTSLGDGEKTIEVEVQAEDKSVTFTINTDKETLGEALLEQKLVSGKIGSYGLFIKVANGITADYDKNQCYWAVNKGGEALLTGVDGEKISDGGHYEIVYTK